MSTEITINQDQIDINVDTTVVTIEAPQGGYPLPNNVYSVFGRIGNVVAQEGDYTLTQLGGVTITNPLTGQALVYNGTSWVNNTETYVGTVTSVNMSVPTGLTISGNPITTAGTLALGLPSGYSIPTTASQATWNTAYNDSIVSAAVTGVETKTLTLNQQDGGTITASWSDYDTAPVTSVFGRTGAITAQSGDYTTTQVTEGTNLYYTDARARGSVSGGTGISYDSSTGVITNTITQYTDSNARAALSFTAGSGAYNSTTGVITIPTNNNQITNGAGYITTADLTGLVPYTGATANVDLGTFDLTTDIVNLNQLKAVGSGGLNIYSNSGTHIALMGGGGGAGTTFYGGIIGTSASFASSGGSDTFAINHSSGSGIALNITKGGNGEGLYINKTSGSGNAATIIGTLNATTLVKNGGTSSQFLKADGSVDATSYQPLITAGTTSQYYRGDKTFQTLDTSVVPENTNLYFTNTRARAAISETVTGLDYDNTTGVLSTSAGYGIPTTASQTNWDTAYTNRITSASAPLSIASNAISISQANATTDGYLSLTDWNTFNNKQAAGNYITALTGEATASGPGSASVTLTNSAVIGKVLTGLNVTGGSVSATDSILDAFGKVQNQINGLIGGSIYQSVWNASTNTPTLTSSVGTKGYYYIVNVAGSTNLNGITDWKVGDWAIYDGTAWQKVDNTDAVSSVNGFTGAVNLTTDNISEGSTNLYFTNTRAQNAITLTTTGTSGAATYTSGTLNIPQYQAVLTNPVTGTGTTNTLPKFTGASAIGNSNITDDGSLITLGSNTRINGNVGINIAPQTSFNFTLASNITGGTGSQGFRSAGIIQSDVTNQAIYYSTVAQTAASSFSLSQLFHYQAFQSPLGAGSAVTSQFGFVADATLIGATNNYGFFGNIPSGTNRWNLYMSGTASNYMAGNLRIGSTSTDGTSLLEVAGNARINVSNNSSPNLTNVPNSTLVSAEIQGSNLTNNGAIAAIVSNAFGNSVRVALNLRRVVSGDVGFAGAGTSILFDAESNVSNTIANQASISALWQQSPTAGNQNASLTFSTALAGTLSERMRIDATGSVGIGTTSLAGHNLRVSKNLTGAISSSGIQSDGVIQSDVTTSTSYNATLASTAAATFTIGTITHYIANQGTFGSGSTVTTQWGFHASSNLIGATNNYGFRGAIPSGTNRWNLFMDGTANNYMAGSLGIGSTSLTGINLRIQKDITGGTAAYGVIQGGTVLSDVTSQAWGFNNSLTTQASAFTLTHYYHYASSQSTIGATSAVTNQYGFYVFNSLTGATNNYGFFGNIPSGTNRWNLYMAGTAANYMAGDTSIGTTTGGYKLNVNGTIFSSKVTNNAAISNSPADASLLLYAPTTTNFYGGIIGWAEGNLAASISAYDDGTGGALGLSFSAGNATTLSERLRIKSTGQVRFAPLASDPSNAQAGDIYYNSTTNALKLYDGTVWRTITVI